MAARMRSAAVAALAVAAASALSMTTSVFAAFAATSLIMGGTGHPLSIPGDTSSYIDGFVSGADGVYIAPSGLCTGGKPGCRLLAVYTPEEFRFDTGIKDMTFDESVAVGQANLDNCIRRNPCTVTQSPFVTTEDQVVRDRSLVVYGYSQSAAVATREKRDLINDPQRHTDVAMILTANPNRPHGGILATFPGLYIPIVGVTFNGATPTNSDMLTVDIVRQYDIVAETPTNPLNLLSDLNALIGNFYLHENYFTNQTLMRQGQYGDTTYYLAPTPVVPLLMPLQIVPIVGTVTAVTLDPFVRTLVETGYDRTINPGEPTPARLLYFPNPIHTAKNLAIDIPTGWDNGLSYLAGDPNFRPFGTPIPTNPYGVNGPPVDTGCGTPPCGPPTPALTAPAAPSSDDLAPSALRAAEDNTSIDTITAARATEASKTTAPADRDARVSKDDHAEDPPTTSGPLSSADAVKTPSSTQAEAVEPPPAATQSSPADNDQPSDGPSGSTDD